MNELQVFSELHKFLNGLDVMNCTLAPRSLTVGYTPHRFGRRFSKFATLYGEKRYNCLILHVDPGNPESTKGKMIQQEVQECLHFEIKDLRSFALKNHEVYIPFEVIDTIEKLAEVKEFVRKQLTLSLIR
jgi:hypothetical protein